MRISHAVLALATLVSVVACSAGAPGPVAPNGKARMDGGLGPMGSGNNSSPTGDSTAVERGTGWIGTGN